MKIYIYGFLFGLFIPFIGISIGLLLSPTLASILLFPLVILSINFDMPIANLLNEARFISYTLLGLSYAIIFKVIAVFIKKLKS